MDLQQRLQTVASNARIQGAQAGLAIAAVVILDANNNIVFDGNNATASLSALLAAALAATDLSALPTSDPGGGLPWLNAGRMQVGA